MSSAHRTDWLSDTHHIWEKTVVCTEHVSHCTGLAWTRRWKITYRNAMCVNLSQYQAAEGAHTTTRCTQQTMGESGGGSFSLDSHHYLVMVDYYSNYIEVNFLSSTTSTAVIHKIKVQFTCHGIPDAVSDGKWPTILISGIPAHHHITTLPTSKREGGKGCEYTVKSLLKKAKAGHTDPYLSHTCIPKHTDSWLWH